MQPTPTIPEGLLVSTVQDAIDELLATHEPVFLQFGLRLFLAFAVIVLAWQGVRMMFTLERGLGDHMFRFAQLLLFISLGYGMIAFYESPLPGIGVSFSNLITDQAHYFATVLDARALQQTWEHLDTLKRRFLQPDPWALLANLLYWVLLILVTIAKILSLAVVAFGLVATAVCGLLGPLFVPFFVLPKLDFLFWSWLKSLLQYSFVQVVAYAFLMIFERFIFRFVEVLPVVMTERQYQTFGLQAFVVIGTFCLGIFLIPSLTSSIFSGHGGESVLPDRILRF